MSGSKRRQTWRNSKTPIGVVVTADMGSNTQGNYMRLALSVSLLLLAVQVVIQGQTNSAAEDAGAEIRQI
jgi:hypothetical protein